MKRFLFLACGFSMSILNPLYAQVEEEDLENHYLADDEELDDMDDEYYNPEEEDPAFQEELEKVDDTGSLSKL